MGDFSCLILARPMPVYAICCCKRRRRRVSISSKTLNSMSRRYSAISDRLRRFRGGSVDGTTHHFPCHLGFRGWSVTAHRTHNYRRHFSAETAALASAAFYLQLEPLQIHPPAA